MKFSPSLLNLLYQSSMSMAEFIELIRPSMSIVKVY